MSPLTEGPVDWKEVAREAEWENAKLRGALLEMLTAHGTRLSYARKLFSWKCDCHACTTARKLLAGE